MTYREYAVELAKNANDKYVLALKAQNELFEQGNGFVAKSYLDKVDISHSDWQIAQNKFNGFVSFLVKHEINWDYEISNT